MIRTRRTDYDFTLETSGRDILDEEVFDALTEAGCDDALIGRVGGVDRLHFIREAGSYCEAVRSAIEDVQSVAGVRVTRVINECAAVGAAFAEAVNAVLASPAQCPDLPGREEQAELRRIREMTVVSNGDCVDAPAGGGCEEGEVAGVRRDDLVAVVGEGGQRGVDGVGETTLG